MSAQAQLAQIEGEEMTLRVAVGARGGAPPVVRAIATGPSKQCDAPVGQVLQSLSEQNVQALLSGSR
jgi:hypothetical protein